MKRQYRFLFLGHYPNNFPADNSVRSTYWKETLLKHFTSTFPDQPWETEIKLYNRKLKVSDQSPNSQTFFKRWKKYANHQMSQFVQKWPQSQQHNWTVIEVVYDEDVLTNLNGMAPFPVRNELTTVTRHRYKTLDGEGKTKLFIYIYFLIKGKAIGPI